MSVDTVIDVEAIDRHRKRCRIGNGVKIDKPRIDVRLKDEDWNDPFKKARLNLTGVEIGEDEEL